jgi:hypothetical protein
METGDYDDNRLGKFHLRYLDSRKLKDGNTEHMYYLLACNLHNFKTKLESEQIHKEAIPPMEMEMLYDPFGQTHNSCKRGS